MKNLLCSSSVLRSPDFVRPFILQTDASDRGVGAVLSQIDGEGEEHPVGYFSRKLIYHLTVQPVENVPEGGITLKTRESHWMRALMTNEPHGLNIRK